jgi:predicted NUDIX family NTP pyrophosphohydrolase
MKKLLRIAQHKRELRSNTPKKGRAGLLRLARRRMNILKGKRRWLQRSSRRAKSKRSAGGRSDG